MSSPIPDWLRQFQTYTPTTPREIADYNLIKRCITTFDNIELFTRDNVIAHFTASGFIVNRARTKALMVYHNIYNSFSWTGGHNDGDTDFYQVALREAIEETGVTNITPISPDMISLEVLEVISHVKKGQTISPHLHLNFSYAFEADENDQVSIKPDENSAVQWVDIETIPQVVSEKHMVEIYLGIIERIKLLDLNRLDSNVESPVHAIQQ